MNNQNTVTIIYIVVIIAVFYFLWIRPQQKQRKAMSEMLAALKPGDEVLTAGGLIGIVRAIGDETLDIEIAAGVIVKFTKPAIIKRRMPGESTDE
jgi:preprotein translocase subunit YajC